MQGAEGGRGGRLEGWWAGEKATPLIVPDPSSCECPGARIPATRRVSDCLLSDWLTQVFFLSSRGLAALCRCVCMVGHLADDQLSTD